MHQIRVHARHLGVPLAVDPLYGARAELDAVALGIPPEKLPLPLTRLPLHAIRLDLPDPKYEGRRIVIEAPMAADMARILSALAGES